jgi:hypothetical protein
MRLFMNQFAPADFQDDGNGPVVAEGDCDDIEIGSVRVGDDLSFFLMFDKGKGVT